MNIKNQSPPRPILWPVFLTLFLFSFSVRAFQLSYVKTDSPRDTMETFMTAMDDYRTGVATRNSQKQLRIQDAIRCFAQSTQVLTSFKQKKEAAIFLKEVIDRVIVVNLQKIPENPAKPRWRLKNTEITLKLQTQGEREGEWLITENTWKRASFFYQKVHTLPYLRNSGKGALYERSWVEQNLPPGFKNQLFGLKYWQWLVVLLALIGGLIPLLLTKLLILFLGQGMEKTLGWKYDWLQRNYRPLSILCTALFWQLCSFYLKLDGLALQMVGTLVEVGLGITLTWMAYRSMEVLCKYWKKQAGLSQSKNQLIPFVEKTAQWIVLVIGLLVTLQNLGIQVLSLVAGLGLGGLAFALAAKDTVANLFGSITILADSPFKLGDWIIVDGKEGVVENIGFRSTRIRTFYNSLISLPNSTIASTSVDNMGQRKYRRVYTTLDLTYDTHPEKLQSFLEGVRKIILDNKITNKKDFHVYFSSYGESSLQVMVYFFLRTQSWAEELSERQSIYLSIYKLAQNLKVDFAYPTQSLLVQKIPPSEQPTDGS